MRATEDRLVPRSAGDYFARLARAGRVVDLEGPHFLLQARPTLAAAEIREFIRKVE
jgi:pimeloyl-ACP methyl ester carboxylesterase